MRESSRSVWLGSFESKSKVAQRTDFSPTHTLSYTDLKSLHFSFHQLMYPFARYTFKLHLRFVSWRIRKEADCRHTTTPKVDFDLSGASRNRIRLLCQKQRNWKCPENTLVSMCIPNLPLWVVCLLCRPSGFTSL